MSLHNLGMKVKCGIVKLNICCLEEWDWESKAKAASIEHDRLVAELEIIKSQYDTLLELSLQQLSSFREPLHLIPTSTKEGANTQEHATVKVLTQPVPWNTMKLVVLGHGEIGKTTLLAVLKKLKKITRFLPTVC